MPDGTIEDKRKHFGSAIGLDWDIESPIANTQDLVNQAAV